MAQANNKETRIVYWFSSEAGIKNALASGGGKREVKKAIGGFNIRFKVPRKPWMTPREA